MMPHSDYVIFVHEKNGDLETVLGPFAPFPTPLIEQIEQQGKNVQVVQRLHTLAYATPHFTPSPVQEVA